MWLDGHTTNQRKVSVHCRQWAWKPPRAPPTWDARQQLAGLMPASQLWIELETRLVLSQEQPECPPPKVKGNGFHSKIKAIFQKGFAKYNCDLQIEQMTIQWNCLFILFAVKNSYFHPVMAHHFHLSLKSSCDFVCHFQKCKRSVSMTVLWYTYCVIFQFKINKDLSVCRYVWKNTLKNLLDIFERFS